MKKNVLCAICIVVFGCSHKNLTFRETHNGFESSRSLDDFSIYVFQMFQYTMPCCDNSNLNTKHFSSNVTKKSDTIVEELYLLFDNTDTTSIYYLTTTTNQYTKPSISDKSPYYSYNLFNTAYHREAILLLELDFLRKGKIQGDKFYFSNSTLVTPNSSDSLVITYKRIKINDQEAIKFISISNDDPHRANSNLIPIDDTLNIDFTFKPTHRRFAYLTYDSKNVQYLDSIHFGQDNVYFSKINSPILYKDLSPYKYVGLKKRYKK